MGHEMRVQIHEPGRHKLPGRVEALHGAVGRDTRRDGGDLAIADPDVHAAPEPLARVQHVAVGDHQLVLEPGIGGIEAPRHRRPLGHLHGDGRPRRGVRRPGGAQRGAGSGAGGDGGVADEVAAGQIHGDGSPDVEVRCGVSAEARP
jgi:hypothetical protein